MPTFRLRYGSAQIGGVFYNAKDPAKRLVVSDTDLVATFGRDKFVKMQPQTSVVEPETDEELDDLEDEDFDETPTLEDDVFDTMTVDELKKFANENDIELPSNVTRKADIIATLRASK